MPDDDRLDDLLLPWEELYEQGHDVPADRLCLGCPELATALAEGIAELKRVSWVNALEGTGTEGRGAPLIEASVPPLQMLGGRYRLEEVLGEGGFGRVWRAFDTELHRPVAVKVSKRGSAADPERFNALVSEARKVARLRHPGIVPVYDAGRHGQSYFVVSELIDGSDLGVRMRQGRLAVLEAVRVVGDVAQALGEAHRRGLVHQDIKPSNILLGADGQVYLTDFGIALDKAGAGEEGEGRGTVAYMSPEQVGGSPEGIDGRSDLYSLGVVLCELVTGVRPPPAARMITGRGAQRRSHPPALTPPSFIHEVWVKCLSDNPADRYATAEELAEHLRKVGVLVLEDEEWLTSTNPAEMRLQVQENATPRKLRLFVCGCVRQTFTRLDDPRSRAAVDVAERHADSQATEAELAAALAAGWEARKERRWTPQSIAAAWAATRNVLAAVYNAAEHTDPGLQCGLLRELFGPSLYRPLDPLAASWNTGTVRSIAQGIYDEQAFDQLPVLADALEEAGCDNADLVNHCRQPGGHARGCWAVDVLLGKR